MLYTYFENLDDLIIQSTEYFMTKVKEEFMEKVPKDADVRYIEYAKSLEETLELFIEKNNPKEIPKEDA